VFPLFVFEICADPAGSPQVKSFPLEAEKADSSASEPLSE
jgi:hypothetical protein